MSIAPFLFVAFGIAFLWWIESSQCELDRQQRVRHAIGRRRYNLAPKNDYERLGDSELKLEEAIDVANPSR